MVIDPHSIIDWLIGGKSVSLCLQSKFKTLQLGCDSARVARCYIFMPKIPMSLYLGGIWNGKYWYVLMSFGNYYSHLVDFSTFCYIESWKIWQPSIGPWFSLKFWIPNGPDPLRKPDKSWSDTQQVNSLHIYGSSRAEMSVAQRT
jgi:hypothetical protein